MIIVDANIIFSAAIKPSGSIGKIIFSDTNSMFIAPDFLKEEIDKHKQKIISVTKKTEEEMDFVLTSIFEKITFYPAGIVSSGIIDESKLIVSNIDPNGFIYIAFAFFFNAKLWSGDKVLFEGLKAKGIDIVATTFDVAIATMK